MSNDGSGASPLGSVIVRNVSFRRSRVTKPNLSVAPEPSASIGRRFSSTVTKFTLIFRGKVGPVCSSARATLTRRDFWSGDTSPYGQSVGGLFAAQPNGRDGAG